MFEPRLGVAIHDHCVRAVLVQRKARQWQPTLHTSVAIDQLDEDNIMAAFYTIKQQLNTRHVKLKLGVPHHCIMTGKIIVGPNLSTNELREYVWQQSARLFKHNSEDLYIDHYVYELSDMNQKVFIFAARNSLIRMLLNAVNDTKLTTDAVNINAFASAALIDSGTLLQIEDSGLSLVFANQPHYYEFVQCKSPEGFKNAVKKLVQLSSLEIPTPIYLAGPAMQIAHLHKTVSEEVGCIDDIALLEKWNLSPAFASAFGLTKRSA